MYEIARYENGMNADNDGPRASDAPVLRICPARGVIFVSL
jgi:hypothetical protein